MSEGWRRFLNGDVRRELLYLELGPWYGALVKDESTPATRCRATERDSGFRCHRGMNHPGTIHAALNNYADGATPGKVHGTWFGQ